MSNGYILLHRSVFDHDHDVFKQKDFTEREAWIWMLCEASYEPHKMRHHNKMMTVDRGSIPTSYRRLRKTWGWGLQRISHFLALLELEGMISRKTDTGFLVITICNYNKYQKSSKKANTTPDTLPDTLPDTHICIKKGKEKKEYTFSEELKENSSSKGESKNSPSQKEIKKIVFDQGLKLLASNNPEQNPNKYRSLVGRWLRNYGDQAVFLAFVQAIQQQPLDAIPYIEKILSKSGKKHEDYTEKQVRMLKEWAERDENQGIVLQ